MSTDKVPCGLDCPPRAVLSRQWAVGQREWKGQSGGLVLWSACGQGLMRLAPGPLGLAAALFLFLLLGLFVWPLLNGPLSAGVGR